MSDLVESDETDTKDIDISQLTNIEDQKDCCDEMVKILFEEQERLNNRFFDVQTIYDILEHDSKLKENMSEYIGYHYGSINESMKMFDFAFENLRKVLLGSLDKLDIGARGMYITIWYNIALEAIYNMDQNCEELSRIESDLVERIMSENNESTTVFKGNLH